MTARYDEDRLLSAWLHDVAPAREPEHLLGQVLARTARTRRRGAWRNPERWNLMSAITSRLAPARPVPWRPLGVALALLLALAVGTAFIAGATRSKPAPPYGLAGSGLIAYSRDGDIFVADGPTVPGRLLLGGPTSDAIPWFSPDGSAFVFLRGPETANEIWVAEADGSKPRKVAGPFSAYPWFEWAPAGDVLVMSDIGGDDSLLTLARTDGTGATTIRTGLVDVDEPFFRPPAGQQISFRGKDAAGDWGYYLVNRDGTGVAPLGLDAGFQNDEFYDENRDFYFLGQSWQSDGNRLVYHTLEPDPRSPAGPGFRLHVVDLDAGGQVLSERTLEYEASLDDEFAAIVIPGTEEVIYRTLEGSRFGLKRASISGTGGASRAFDIQAADFIDAALSPDARQLIVVVRHTAPGVSSPDAAPPDVLLIDLESGAKTTLALSPEFNWQRRGR